MVIALYVLYLAICAGLTVVVGSALARSGRVVMTAMFGDEGLADAVSRLVVLALYLLNFGYVALTLGATRHVATAADAVGILLVKLGEELLVLGGLHLTSLIVLARIRRRQRLAGSEPGPPPWLVQHPPRAGAGTRAS
jgi:cytochrome c biogenesis factor